MTIPVLTLIMNMSTVAVMWFGAMRVADGAMGIGNLTAFLQYLLLIMFSVLTSVLMFILVPRAAVSSGRIVEVLDTAALHPRSGRARSDPGRRTSWRGRVP